MDIEIKQDHTNTHFKKEIVEAPQVSQKLLLAELEAKIQQVFLNSQIQFEVSQNSQPCLQIAKFKNLATSEPWNLLQKESLVQIYKSLFAPKLVKYMMDQINQKMRESFQNQSEKQIKKKLIKIDEIYDFFGIKIIMGHIKMPTLEDYFDETQLFQCKIFDCFKEGRFKCLEQWSCFTDQELLRKENKQSLNEFSATRVCKKIGKIAISVKNPGRDLILQVNPGFIVQNGQQIILCDAQNKLILWSHFCETTENFTNLEIVQLLAHFKDKNHILYCYDNILTVEQIIFLKLEYKIQCVGSIKQVVNTPYHNSVISIINWQNETIAITAGDNLEEILVNQQNFRERMLYYSIHKNRPLFSYSSYSSGIMTELQEIIIWNLWVLTGQKQQSYEQFRLTFSQELLKNKITQIKNVPTFLHKSKVQSVLINTDSSGNYGQGLKNSAPSLFHIPTILATPKSYAGSMNCLVCKRNTQLITQCKSCSEISGKLVILCACDCFYLFHQNTTEYIINGEEITMNQYKQIEQSSQQLYFQAFQQKPGLMYENPDKPKQIAYAKQVELE